MSTAIPPSPPIDDRIGPRIVAYVETVKGRESMKAWCDRNGLSDVSMSKWKGGKEPARESLLVLARALGMTLGQFYVTVLGMSPDEFAVPDLDFAIDNDPTLYAWQRQLLHEIVDGMRRQTDPTTGMPRADALAE